MSLLIKGMKMPENCDVCPFDNGVNCMVYPPSEDMVYDIADGKPKWCPLIELPPHGRLIDEDAIYNCDMLYRFITYQGNWVYARKAIQYAPTIIEAESEDV